MKHTLKVDVIFRLPQVTQGNIRILLTPSTTQTAQKNAIKYLLNRYIQNTTKLQALYRHCGNLQFVNRYDNIACQSTLAVCKLSMNKIVHPQSSMYGELIQTLCYAGIF